MCTPPPRWRTQNGQSLPRGSHVRGLRRPRTPPPVKHFRRYQVPREGEVTERSHLEPSWLSSTTRLGWPLTRSSVGRCPYEGEQAAVEVSIPAQVAHRPLRTPLGGTLTGRGRMV